jgi:transcriptional regulator NrdR family protein
MKCPKCNEEMVRSFTHHKSGGKSTIHQERCVDCDIVICWFEVKEGYIYTLKQEKDEN